MALEVIRNMKEWLRIMYCCRFLLLRLLSKEQALMPGRIEVGEYEKSLRELSLQQLVFFLLLSLLFSELFFLLYDNQYFLIRTQNFVGFDCFYVSN